MGWHKIFGIVPNLPIKANIGPSGRSNPAAHRNNVVFPDPEAPKIPTIPCLGRFKSTSNKKRA